MSNVALHLSSDPRSAWAAPTLLVDSLAGELERRAHYLLQGRGVLEPLPVPPQARWVDLAQHLERLWANYKEAAARHSPSNVYAARFTEIDGLFLFPVAAETPGATTVRSDARVREAGGWVGARWRTFRYRATAHLHLLEAATARLEVS